MLTDIPFDIKFGEGGLYHRRQMKCTFSGYFLSTVIRVIQTECLQVRY